MKSNECPIGARVGKNNHGTMYKGAVITEVTKRGDGVDMVVVEWDNYGQIQKVEVNSLVPESEIDKEVARLQTEKLRYEEEFARVAAQVKVKADAAAALINQAQELAKTLRQEARYMGDACDNLQEALDSSGWYQSTAVC